MNIYRLTMKLIMRMKRIILPMAGIFLVFVIIVSGDFYTKDERIAVLLINEDKNTPLTEHFVSYMEKYVKVTETVYSDKRRLGEALFYEREKCTIEIPEDFTYNYLKDGQAKLTRKQLAETQDSVVVDILISKYLSILNSKHGMPLTKAVMEMDKELSNAVTVSCIEKKHIKEERFGMLANYLAYALFSIILPYTVYVLFHLKKSGIENHSRICPMNAKAMYRQALAVCIATGIIFAIVLLFFGGLLMGIDFQTPNVWMIVINVINCTIYCAAIGAFIGMIVKEIKNFDYLLQTLAIGFSFLSGVFVRQEMLPEKIRHYAKFIPTFLYVSINDNWCNADVFKFHDYQIFAIQEGTMFCVSIIWLLIALIIGEKKIEWDF